MRQGERTNLESFGLELPPECKPFINPKGKQYGGVRQDEIILREFEFIPQSLGESSSGTGWKRPREVEEAAASLLSVGEDD